MSTVFMSVVSYLHLISQDGVTALMVASGHGHPSVVRTLLKAGATVNTTGQVGYTLNSTIMFGSMILFVMTLAYSEAIQVDLPDLCPLSWETQL